MKTGAVAAFPHPFQYTFLQHTQDLMVDTTSLYPRTCTSLPRSTLYTTIFSQRSGHQGLTLDNFVTTSFPFQSHPSAITYIQSCSVRPNRRRSPHIRLPPQSFSRVPPRTSSKCSKNRNHNAGTRHDSPISISTTHNIYSLFLVSQPR